MSLILEEAFDDCDCYHCREAAMSIDEDDFDELYDELMPDAADVYDECAYCITEGEPCALCADISGPNDEPESNTNPTEEILPTMKLNKDITPAVFSTPVQISPAKVNKISLEFSSESEYQDVVAALAAYGRKTTSVSRSTIASDLGLSQYSGNARRTVNQLLAQLP